MTSRGSFPYTIRSLPMSAVGVFEWRSRSHLAQVRTGYHSVWSFYSCCPSVTLCFMFWNPATVNDNGLLEDRKKKNRIAVDYERSHGQMLLEVILLTFSTELTTISRDVKELQILESGVKLES